MNDMRLGDLDAIEKFIEDGLNNPDKLKAFGHDAIEIMSEVHYAPTIDAVPVVRCKDCKRSKTAFDGLFCDHALPTKRLEEIIFCGTTVLSRVKPDDFCSCGERKDGEG